MAIETSLTVQRWAEETFGPVKDMSDLVRRVRLELDELEEAVRLGNLAEIGPEAADVAILLHRLAALYGTDLADEVDTKMKINRGRRWVADGSGTGRHV
ncbi:MAG: nucleotide pyrophosphohydrolase [Alphaproteobacteria bacterium]|nr:nucleotide pyrophosphohydrolase [Alphaproteobacteria bacterium]